MPPAQKLHDLRAARFVDLARWLAGRYGIACPSVGWLRTTWLAAHRDITARVLISAAREGWVDATVADDALTVAGLPPLLLRRRGAFGLHVPDFDAPSSSELDDPVAVWGTLANPWNGNVATVARIAAELRESALYLAWARLLHALKPFLYDREDPRMLDAEHWVVDGHPWHPMTRLRRGLSLAQNLWLAPEAAAAGPVRVVEVDMADARRSEGFEEMLAPWIGVPSRGRVRLPVHAAQLPRVQRKLAQQGYALRSVPVRLQGRALLSLRTVALPWARPQLHCKLALDVHTTSARRVVSAMSVWNSPRVSRLLASITEADPELHKVPMRVVAESHAAGLASERFGPLAHELGVIVRDAAAFEAPPGGSCWVCAALGSNPAPGGATPIDTMIDAVPGDTRLAQARRFIEAYARALVPPLVRLLVVYGISLEAHLQNTVVRFDGKRLMEFVVRDLGGIRIHGPRLRGSGHALALHPDSFIITDDLQEVRDKLGHTLFQAHLGSVLRWVADASPLPEAQAWSIVREVVRETFEALKADPAHRDRAESDRQSIMAPQVRAKALLRMRIDDAFSNYSYAWVDNPLACDRDTR